MININTMNKLEELGIGSDVDRLENYVALITYSEIMGNCITSADNKDIYINLLKELKPDSEVLKYNFDLASEEIDEFDELYKKYGKLVNKSINIVNNDSLKDIIDTIDKNGGSSDLYAFALPDGIDIRVIYRKGIYYAAYTYKNGNKGKDITEHIRYLVPHNLQEISDTHLIEVRAVITMTNTSLKELGMSERDKMEFIVDFLTHDVYLDNINKFVVKAYKIYCDDPELEITTLWEEHNILLETELDIVTNALIRNITKEDLIRAVKNIERYFKYEEEKDFIYSSIIITLNNADDIILKLSEKDMIPKVLSSKLINIKWDNSLYCIVPELIIENTKINNNKTIDKIRLSNIKQLNKLDLKIGDCINFYVDYKDDIIICDNQGNKIV